jgi:hypothetical protein
MGNFCENDPSLQCADDGDCTSVGGTCALYSFSTDFAYSLKPDVGQLPGLLLPGTLLSYHDAPAWHASARSVAWSMKPPGVLLGLAKSVDDPRCNDDPRGTVKAFMRFVRDGTALAHPQIELPCEGWHLRGDPANPRSYEYRDLWGVRGACRKVTIDVGAGITAQCSGPGVPANMAGAHATLDVAVKTGTLRCCTQYTSFRTFRRSIAISKDNPSPDSCNVWRAPGGRSAGGATE